MENIDLKVNEDNRFFWTEPRVSRLRDLVAKGYGESRCAQALGEGCTRSQVRHAREKLKTGEVIKLGPVVSGIAPEDLPTVREMYVVQRLTIIEISRRLGYHRDMIRKYLTSLADEDAEVAHRRADNSAPQRKRTEAAKRNQALLQAMQKPIRELCVVKTERQRAKLYNGQRYEDADVPKTVPRCGRLG